MANRYVSFDEIMDSSLFDKIITPPKSKRKLSYDSEVEDFLEIVNFYKEHGREPEKTTDPGRLLERQLSSRLIGIKKNADRLAKLERYDDIGLLKQIRVDKELKSVDDILKFGSSELLNGMVDMSAHNDIFNTSRYRAVENKPDYIAKRKMVRNFSKYETLFKRVQKEIAEGIRNVVPFKNYDIKQGSFFIQKGVLLYIDSVGEFFKTDNGEDNARLHVIYENGTESNVLLRSLAANLYRTGSGGKMVTDNIDNVMSGANDKDISSGYIYILKSLSTHPEIKSIANLYKVGVTKGPVKKRITNAINESTYLYAPVEIVSTYHVYNFDAGKFEGAIHKVLGNHKLDIEIVGANGRMIIPREWFVISLEVLDEVINEIVAKIIISD